jgi:DNA repair exonuclease SbcCD ATPase subunit
MASRKCPVCGNPFEPRPQVKDQKFCSTEECQRERKRRWQHEKRQTDPAYTADQREHAKKWADLHPNYSREYRAKNPDSAKRNRDKQQNRNEKRRVALIAKMDVSKPEHPVPSGIYRLTPIDASGIAKMDAWIVKITLIS